MDNRSLFDVFIGDGRPLLVVTGLLLAITGLFVIVQSLTGHFLPHDVAYLGMDAAQLSAYNDGRITNFMFHDRIAFGGSIVAVGGIYMWLAEFPLRRGEPWAWYLFLFSGIVGFGSFMTYLGHGYLDSWHGIATLMLLPVYALGMWRSYQSFAPLPSPGRALKAAGRLPGSWSFRAGRRLLFVAALGMFAGGVTIMTVGMTTVFVPQDLSYMAITSCGLEEISPVLTPLIAHDRASFGGGIATIGMLYFFILYCSPPSVSLWQILLVTMIAGYGSAIGVHYYIGYTDAVHLLPAFIGAGISVVGLAMTAREMLQRTAYVLS